MVLITALPKIIDTQNVDVTLPLKKPLKYKWHTRCSRLLLVAFEDGIEGLEAELLLFTREELDLLELSLQLRLRAGIAS